MGWIRLKASFGVDRLEQGGTHPYDASVKEESTEHIEVVNTHDDPASLSPARTYPFQPKSIPEASLPFISASIVVAQKIGKRKEQRTWIVVDNIVYDCADFVHEHPGGNDVIESFRGEDCSWQFWRFHNKEHLKEIGGSLRVGRTKGVKNRFPEPKQFIGSSIIGSSDEW
ncbi:hypothetical protein CBER1_06280 [Cercospora berteroae]|uniref:Cytochrome b5 heme-binding domain-containing protein n=1 Tax=Cercospora berteroae TaxID=357750 RepID=A0A2S6BSX3_9PEZI|nr:hypothetical protein CBER1_06280 [Cercospora berteroae]